jgi:hypothetical protein
MNDLERCQDCQQDKDNCPDCLCYECGEDCDECDFVNQNTKYKSPDSYREDR